MNSTVSHKMLRSDSILILMISILALVIRLINLGAESMWHDETFTVQLAANHSATEIITNIIRLDCHPPAHVLYLRVWGLLFGFSDLSCRMSSVLPGVITITGIFLLAKRCCQNRIVAVLSALFAAVSPTMIWFSQECRMYSLLIMTFTLCLIALFECISRDFQWNYIVLVIAAFISFAYMHSSSGFLILPFLYCMIVFSYGLNMRKNYKRRAVLLGMLFLVYVPWIINLFNLYALKRQMDVLSPRAMFGLAKWLVFFQAQISVPAKLIAGAFFFLLLTAGFLKCKKQALAGQFLYGALIVPLVTCSLLTYISPFYLPRALVFLTVPLYICLAVGISALTDNFNGYTSTKSAFISPLLGISLSGSIIISLLLVSCSDCLHRRQKEQWREAVSFVAGKCQPHDGFVFFTGMNQCSFDHYFFGYDTDPVHKKSEYRYFPINGNPSLEVMTDTLKTFPPATTVWVFYSHNWSDSYVDIPIRQQGFTKVNQWHGTGVAVKAFRRTEKSEGDTRVTAGAAGKRSGQQQ